MASAASRAGLRWIAPVVDARVFNAAFQSSPASQRFRPIHAVRHTLTVRYHPAPSAGRNSCEQTNPSAELETTVGGRKSPAPTRRGRRAPEPITRGVTLPSHRSHSPMVQGNKCSSHLHRAPVRPAQYCRSLSYSEPTMATAQSHQRDRKPDSIPLRPHPSGPLAVAHNVAPL